MIYMEIKSYKTCNRENLNERKIYLIFLTIASKIMMKVVVM